MVRCIQGVSGVLDYVRSWLLVHDTQLHIKGDAIQDTGALVPRTAQANPLENLAPVYQGRRLHQTRAQRVIPVEV